MADKRIQRRVANLISAQNMMAMALAKNEWIMGRIVPDWADAVDDGFAYKFGAGPAPTQSFDGQVGYLFDDTGVGNNWPILSREAANNEDKCLQGFGSVDFAYAFGSGKADTFPIAYKSTLATLPSGASTVTAIAVQSVNAYHENLLTHTNTDGYLYFYFAPWVAGCEGMYRIRNNPTYGGTSFFHSSPTGDYLWEAPTTRNVARVIVHEIAGGVVTKVLDSNCNLNEDTGIYETDAFEVKPNCMYYVSIHHDQDRFVYGDSENYQQTCKPLFVAVVRDKTEEVAT